MGNEERHKQTYIADTLAGDYPNDERNMKMRIADLIVSSAIPVVGR